MVLSEKLLFCRALSGPIKNFEFSLQNFDDDGTLNNSIAN